MFVVVPGAEPLPLAVDDNEVVRGAVAAIVLRRLLVAPDAIFDLSHLAIVLGHHIPSKPARMCINANLALVITELFLKPIFGLNDALAAKAIWIALEGARILVAWSDR